MKFIFLKSGDYLELEPNNTPIATAWFTIIFYKKRKKGLKSSLLLNINTV